MIVLVPLGLLAPGTAWGEWGAQELTSRGLAFVPQGMAKLSGLWSAPMYGYDLPALKNSNLGYILSGIVGTIAIGIVAWLFTMLVTMRKPEARVSMVQPSIEAYHPQQFRRTDAVDINHTMEQSLFAETTARQPGWLQQLDPRLKILSMLLVLLAVSLSRNLLVILVLYFLVLGLAFFSKIPLGFFVKRVWLLIPFFTGVVALPALFITPGSILVHLPLGLVITRTGLTTALFLLLRVGTSVSVAVLLVLTTPWNSVLKASGACASRQSSS